MRKAVLAGTYDLLTNGHEELIEHGAKLFDRLVVAIGENPNKKCMFSLNERLDMLRATTARFPNVDVAHYCSQFLVHYAKHVGAEFILRGIRNESDYEYERVMHNVNCDIDKGITTLFVMPSRSVAEISSSMVKGLIGPYGWEHVVKQYVPEAVFQKLLEVYHGNV